MHSKQQFCNSLSRTTSRAATGTLVIVIVFALTVVLTQPVQAQTFKVIYNFTGGVDGAQPAAGLSMDATGSLYGTAWAGGYSGHSGSTGNDCYSGGCGTVFKLTKTGSDWAFTSLYAFLGGVDGVQILSTPTVGPDGAVYGTTRFGGPGCYRGKYAPAGCGIVFKLSSTEDGHWVESIVHRFKGRPDGEDPLNSPVTFDGEGNIYLTTGSGGMALIGGGTVVKLSPAPGEWTESILHNFQWFDDGSSPVGGVIFDGSGRLYGVTFAGGTGGGHCTYCGTVFQLTSTDSGWTKRTIYTFRAGPDGEMPWGGLIGDRSGHLFGTTSGIAYPSGGLGPAGTGGCVFMVTPSGDGWSFEVLHSFVARPNYTESGPNGVLVLDASGNVYGTTFQMGAYNYGSVFKLTPSADGWTYTSLHDFTGGEDGLWPNGLTIDSEGNLYGTAREGGTYGAGVVFQITP